MRRVVSMKEFSERVERESDSKLLPKYPLARRESFGGPDTLSIVSRSCNGRFLFRKTSSVSPGIVCLRLLGGLRIP